jgi:hypothetical protein
MLEPHRERGFIVLRECAELSVEMLIDSNQGAGSSRERFARGRTSLDPLEPPLFPL